MKNQLSVIIFSVTCIASTFGDQKPQCGISNRVNNESSQNAPINSRSGIMYGKIVDPPYKYPWQVDIFGVGRMEIKHSCGGSIISDSLILTAGHCVSDGKSEVLVVMAGRFDQWDFKSPTQFLDVDWFKTHPKFDGAHPIPYYDFALIKLRTPIQFNDNVRPICLPESDDWVDYQGVAVVSGWGYTEYGDDSRYLREVELPFVSNSECVIHDQHDQPYNTEATTKEGNLSMVCAGFQGEQSHHKSACHGDSGGPLQVEDNGIFTLVGVVSGGSGACERDPSIFARVTTALPWIKKVM